MLKMNPTYLAHEYLDEHWDLFWFADVAARLAEAKLSYVASATLAENLDAYSVPQDLRALVRQIDDPVLRESARDMAGNKRFRRDLFARGARAEQSGRTAATACRRFPLRLSFRGNESRSSFPVPSAS